MKVLKTSAGVTAMALGNNLLAVGLRITIGNDMELDESYRL